MSTLHQIDYITFTYSPEYALGKDTRMGAIEKLAHGAHIAQQVNESVDFGEWEEKGLHGFTFTSKLTVQNEVVGYVASGGQHGKVMVQLSGTGCLGVDWRGTHDLLERLGAKLTRIDVCVDCMEGEHTVHEVREAYQSSQFDKRGQRPTCELRGPWDNPEKWGDGLSYYVGKATNGLGYVAYEKGKQLGDPTSKWVRHECRWGSTSKKKIPLEILLKPYDYMAKAYEYLAWVEHAEPVESTHYHIQKERIKLNDLIHWAKQSYGKLFNVLKTVGHSKEQIFDLLKTAGAPKRLLLRKDDIGRILVPHQHINEEAITYG